MSGFRNRGHVFAFMLVVAAVAVSGCRPIRPFRPGGQAGDVSSPRAEPQGAASETALIEVATSERLWTGVAVARDGRIFVSYPRWSDDVPFSVGEVLASGEVVPFPDEDWNAWDTSLDPGDHLICVQSVHIDDADFLWILDPASPMLVGVIAGGAKLLKVDLKSGKVVQRIVFDETIAPAGSYLNDVRVDTGKKVAYITDSGLGAIVVVDLAAAKSRRLLGNHPSTKSEGVVLTVGGRQWRTAAGTPEVHSDGLALDGRGEYLYYQALTGRTLYRIETRCLLDPTLSESQIEAGVESMGRTGAADGMEFGPDGYLYLAAIEDNAIKTFAALGRAETVVEDARLLWPDSIARGPDGYLYVTTSQLHLGADVAGPYRILKFRRTG
jgi:sugar lactone lactonase YvrE